MTWTIIVLAILALVLWSFYISWRASRLDRLHNRVESARTALDLALVRRASAAADLASSGLLDPATSLLLADAVRRASKASPAERDLAESDLTSALRATLLEPGIRGELEEGGPASPAPASAALSAPRPPGTGPVRALPQEEGPAEEEGAEELVDEVEKAARQVYLARKFYNDV
ncbi:MAG TPA: hypothetical protein VFR49_04595, partial [Solirubrobacteraceae bacterium]|nr:hypothetical protein [Solirubrobacteraceae bacterium]